MLSLILFAISAISAIPVGGPSLCPTPDEVWQELEGLLVRQEHKMRLRASSADEPPVRIEDFGPSFRIALLGRSREYQDEAKDCPRRARIAALFAILVLDRGENSERSQLASQDTAPPSEAKAEGPGSGRGRARESARQGRADLAQDSSGLAQAEPPPPQPAPPSPLPPPPPPPERPGSPALSPGTVQEPDRASRAAARLEGAGAMMVGLDNPSPHWGGVLRLGLESRPFGLTLGLGGVWPAETTVAGIRVRQWRAPADISVRATVATRRVSWYGELGVVGAILGERGVALPTTKSGTAIELGGRVALGARIPSSAAVAVLVGLSLDVIPRPPSIAALPNVEHTSHLWLAAYLGASWGLR